MQQLVEDFHDLLIPDALEYYLGLNQDFDMLGMDEDDESEDDGDGDDSDGDAPPGGGKKKKKGKKDGAGGNDDDPMTATGPDG